jgi:arginase family enzyme
VIFTQEGLTFVNNCGVEVLEYNPYHDKRDKTEKLIKEILLSIFGVYTK